MRWRRVAILVLILALYGCQPPPPTIFAMMEGGRLVFHIRDHADLVGKIFGWDDDAYAIEHFLVTLHGRPVVGLSPGRSAAPCNRSMTFPLALGDIRCGYVWHGRTTLQRGSLYEIRLDSRRAPRSAGCANGDCRTDEWWSGYAIGAFVIRSRGTVVNVRSGEPANECGATDAAYSAIYEEVAKACLSQSEQE